MTLAEAPIDPAVPLLADAQLAHAPALEMPNLPGEGKVKRFTFLAIAVGIAIGFFVASHGYWVNVHTGVDQNGYLVGGKQFAANLSMMQSPRKPGDPNAFDPHAFIANMWVTAANNPHDFYPKYPLGLPLIYAICLWVGGSLGTTLCYLISPVAMTIAVLGVFVIVRQFAGSFGAILAMLVFATSPTMAYLVNNPNSHATTVLCVVWGMICVLHWWRRGGRAFAFIGGLLVGYAATIRYTEGALILPLLWAAVVRLNWRSRCGAWLESALLLVGWAIPVVLLLTYNLVALGTWTGYDATHESFGFSWTFFHDNWNTLLEQMNMNGLFMIFSIAVVGLIAMFWWNWRIAVFIWLWIGPCVTTYTFYYWGPDNVSYLRFVLTIFPPMLVAAFWVMAHLRDWPAEAPRRVPLYAMLLFLTLAGLAAAVAAFYILRVNIPELRPDLSGRAMFGVTDYLDQAPTGYQRLGSWGAFIASIVFIGVVGAVFGASAFLRRSIVPTLAASAIACLSVAAQIDTTTAWLEREHYDAEINHLNGQVVRQTVPDGAMLICRDEGLLEYLQFVTNDLCYTGLSFDRKWVDSRPRAATEDPVLVDPVRGQQLFDALAGFDQKALNEQARMLVQQGLAAKRRVFVVEAMPLEPMIAAEKKHGEGPVPEFIRRYINRPKDPSLVGKRVTWWNVPMIVKDEIKPAPRGSKGFKPIFRDVTYQIWEITGNHE